MFTKLKLTILKIIFLPFLSILFFFSLQGQNLVPNPSFEDTVQCPTPFSQLQFASGWVSPNGYSPDYYHSCANSSNPNYGVPNNYYGFQNARTGIAYGGIFLPVAAGNDLREYAQIQLIDTLVSGVEYIVKFYVSLADSSEYSVNAIGAYLSKNAISSPSLKVFNVTPQIVNNSTTNPLTNKNIWYEILDTLIAVGGEEYITIGNFEADSTADTTSVSGGSTSGEAYYYLDDVSIEPKPNSINYMDVNNILKFYPNPTSNILNIKISKTGCYTIQLLDVLGNVVSNKKTVKGDSVLHVEKYPNGIYFIQLSNENEILTTSKIIINH
jgi:hypothetical protein